MIEGDEVVVMWQSASNSKYSLLIFTYAVIEQSHLALLDILPSHTSRPLRKNNLHIPQVHRKMILRLRQNPTSILMRRQLQIKRSDKPRRKRSQLHESKVLANTAIRSHTERSEGVLVLHLLFGAPRWRSSLSHSVQTSLLPVVGMAFSESSRSRNPDH